MNIFVYSDESGVFDYKHYDYYVFGGVILLSKDERDVASRKYIAAERAIKKNYAQGTELKASIISNKDKGKLYRSLNNVHKFGVVVCQKDVLQRIYQDKKSKQRYLDYVYKMALKNYFVRLIKERVIDPLLIDHVHVFVDEHSTATNGRYELRQALEEEFKRGTYNFNWNYFYPPIFPNMSDVTLEYCDSKTKPLIRAADIVANNIYHKAVSLNRLKYSDEHTGIITLPKPIQ